MQTGTMLGCIKNCVRCDFERYCLHTGTYSPDVTEVTEATEAGEEAAGESAPVITAETETASQDAEPETTAPASKETSAETSAAAPAPEPVQKGDGVSKGSPADRIPLAETAGADAGGTQTDAIKEPKEPEETAGAVLVPDKDLFIMDQLRALLDGQEPVQETLTETEPASWTMDSVQYGELTSILLLILFGIGMCLGAIIMQQFWKGVNNGY